MLSFWETLTKNSDLFIPGFLSTIYLFIIAAIGSLVLGTALAAMRVSPVPAMRAFGASYVNVIRNTPLTLVFVFLVFATPKLDVAFPSTFGQNGFFTIAYSALTIYTSAFVCEVVRSGVNTVSPGQSEAARAIGMTFGQVLGLIVMPQAFRAIVPPLSSVMIALLKNTTIAGGFSVLESAAIRQNISERGGDQIHTILWTLIFFLILITPLVALQRAMERRWAVSR
ncbi:MAG: ABC transporter permease subunit [Micromonosporaceae bacterium]|nr:ABC transporter permease subunit [Micromonosporaceae bacterium]